MAQASSGSLQLQRSAVSFRRQGSSGLVWNDRFFSGELARPNSRTQPKFLSGELARPNRAQSQLQSQSQRLRRRNDDQDIPNVVDTAEVNVRPIRTVRSNEGRPHYQESDEPPSPRLTRCGCCAGLGKSPKSGRSVRQVKSRSR